VATAREKDRPKPAATLRKAPEEPVIAPCKPQSLSGRTERPVDGKNGGAKSESPEAIHNDTRKARVGPRASGGEGHGGPSNAVEKKPSLGIERRAPVMPEDRQSQLKLLIARGKEQGYLTYAR